MKVILEIKNGPFAGRRIEIKEGNTATIGRAHQASFSLPHDTFMSGVHFALENSPQGSRVTDRTSSNGTSVNGMRITEAIVRDGDEITAGHTTFVLRIVETPEARSSDTAPGPSPAPNTIGSRAPGSKNPLLAIGSWSFGSVPPGWEPIEQQGIRRTGKDIFPSNAVVSEEPLPAGKTLQEYVESQTIILSSIAPELHVEAPSAAVIAGAEEALDLEIRHTAEDGRPVLQRQLYVRAKQLVGVLTFTTLESDLPAVQPAFDAILSGATFMPQ